MSLTLALSSLASVVFGYITAGASAPMCPQDWGQLASPLFESQAACQRVYVCGRTGPRIYIYISVRISICQSGHSWINTQPGAQTQVNTTSPPPGGGRSGLMLLTSPCHMATIVRAWARPHWRLDRRPLKLLAASDMSCSPTPSRTGPRVA